MDSAAATAKSLQSCLTLWPHRQQPTRLRHPWDSPDKNTRVGCHLFLQCMKVKSESEVAQSCPTLSDPMDCSLPGSSVRGIFQASTGVGCPHPNLKPQGTKKSRKRSGVKAHLSLASSSKIPPCTTKLAGFSGQMSQLCPSGLPKGQAWGSIPGSPPISGGWPLCWMRGFP